MNEKNISIAYDLEVELKARFQTGLQDFVSYMYRNAKDGKTYQTPGGVEHRQPGIAQNRRNYALKLQYKF